MDAALGLRSLVADGIKIFVTAFLFEHFYERLDVLVWVQLLPNCTLKDASYVGVGLTRISIHLVLQVLLNCVRLIMVLECLSDYFSQLVALVSICGSVDSLII